MSQEDKAEKKATASMNLSSKGWKRKSMTKTVRKGRKNAKKVVGHARRRVGVALIKESLDRDLPLPPTPEGLEPPDYAQCQADITTNVNARNMMTMGGKIGGTERCENKPTTLVSETKNGKDGKRGSMTLCESCLKVFMKQTPNYLASYSLVSIDGILQYRWDMLPEDTKRLFEAHGLKRP